MSATSEAAPRQAPRPDQESARNREDDRLQANKAIARRVIVEAIDGGSLEALHELVAADYVEHRSADGEPSSFDDFRQWIVDVHQGFPDWRHTIDDVIAEADRVMIRNRVFGTHRGEFMGIAPTGKQIVQNGFDLFRIKDGKVVEHWGEYDWLGLYHQIGALHQIADREEPHRR